VRVSISVNKIWSLIFIIVLIKFIFFIYFQWFSLGTIFGSGNDADYYNLYALGFGEREVVTNYWPVILRSLNEIGLYNRNIISFISFVTSMTLLPFIYYKMVKIKADEIKLVKAGSYFLIIFYPTLFYLTGDVYRDVFMFVILVLCLLLYKNILEINLLKRYVYFLIYFGLAYFLYMLRPYLGFALGLTPFVYLILLKTKRHVMKWIIVYFVTLVLLKNFGGIDQILDYREAFQKYHTIANSGTTMGIDLNSKGPIMFLFYYTYTILAQLFGLFLVNISAYSAFFLESVPFTLAFIYLFKNIKFMNNFSIFLVTFFVIYSTIWLLGNDNLGTAVRLRIPSYLAIFASMFIVYQTKVVVIYEKIKRREP